MLGACFHHSRAASTRNSSATAGCPVAHRTMGVAAEAARAAIGEFADAGFDHLALINAGPDPDAFLDAFGSGLGDAIRG